MRIPDVWCTSCGESAPMNTEIVHQDYCKTPDAADIHIGPDCLNGKHRACRTEAWCLTEDEPAFCECECHDDEQALANVRPTGENDG